jgi:hypothetical protein
VSVTVKVDTEGCLLSAGQGSRKAAGAVQEIVQTRGEPGVVGDSESDLVPTNRLHRRRRRPHP